MSTELSPAGHFRTLQAFRRLLSLILPNTSLDTSRVHRVSSRNERLVTINILPDDVLLHIFLFDRAIFLDQLQSHWKWHRLVHVCRRWRSVVFASPNFLDLKLIFRTWRTMKPTDIWPPLPIVMTNRVSRHESGGCYLLPEEYDFDAIVHHIRLYEIDLIGSGLQRLASTMQEQLPALRRLRLSGSEYQETPALSNCFLGGSAPNLQSLELKSILFPALPKLLLSAIDLVHLHLLEIPHSGYISPEEIVSGLAVMGNLQSLIIGFKSPLSLPDRESRRPPPPTRTALPALTRFQFEGVSEYLEDLVAWIDAPLLDDLSVTFFHQLLFDIPRVAQFMRRMARFQGLNEAGVKLGHSGVWVESLPPTTAKMRFHLPKSRLRISCTNSDWQLSSLAQVLTSFFPSILMVEHLYIYGYVWIDDIENVQWLDNFHPFTALRNLYVVKELARPIAAALQELVRGRVTDVLPALECLFLEGLEPSGSIQEAFGEFVAGRQLFGQRITISLWERNHEVTVSDEGRSMTRFCEDPRGWTSLEFRSQFEAAKIELAAAERRGFW